MTPGSLAFMLGSWAFVLGLMSWSYTKILSPRAAPPPASRPDDDHGPAATRVPPAAV